MIEKSLLNNKIIKEIVKQNYNIEIKSIKKINRGSANIYLLYTIDNKKLILKEFQTKYTKKEIDKEIDIIRFLSKHKIKVPKYIKLLNGDYSFLFNNHVVIIQKYIEGYIMEKNKGDLYQILESARYLAKIVKILEKYEHENNFKRENWFPDSFDYSIDKYQKLKLEVSDDDLYRKEILADLDIKISMMQALKNRKFYELDKLSIKFTHGDYSVMQFIYEDNKIKAILDFASSCDIPIVWEIIRSYSYIDKKCSNGEFDIDNFIKYVNEYTKYSQLNKYDLKFMPYIYLFQLLKSSFGYEEYIEQTNIELLDFGFFRTKIAKYLFNHAEEITNRLLEEIKY